MVPGGLLVMSRTTQVTSLSSLIIREEMVSRRSFRELGPIGCHRVFAGHSPHGYKLSIGSLVSLYADGSNVR